MLGFLTIVTHAQQTCLIIRSFTFFLIYCVNSVCSFRSLPLIPQTQFSQLRITWKQKQVINISWITLVPFAWNVSTKFASGSSMKEISMNRQADNMSAMIVKKHLQTQMPWNITRNKIMTAPKVHCESCGHKFTSTSSLEDNNEVQHNNASRFSCDECSATFSVKRSMLRHKREIHKSDKKNWSLIQSRIDLDFKCAVCMKVFKREDGLNVIWS